MCFMYMEASSGVKAAVTRAAAAASVSPTIRKPTCVHATYHYLLRSSTLVLTD